MQHFTFKMPTILRGSQKTVSLNWAAHSSWLIAFFACFFTFSVMGQQPMPVTGSLQVNTPYPAKWSEYAATGANIMGLNLTLNEAELGAMNVRLKLYIERNNTLIATSSDVVTGVPTLNLVPYVTRQLGSLDLNPYFRFENLQGFSTPQYQQPLEDGVYRLSFEVVNATTGQRLSAPIGQSMFITLNDAPQLTQPSRGEQIATTSGSNLSFQWLSRATTALPLQYEWTVIEVPVGATNVEALWATAPVLYRATVATNTLPRPVSNFTTGKTYAWRVQAKATSGMSLFKNNGFSETFSFQMGSVCPAVVGLALTAKASDVIAVSWTGATTYYNYRVAYRKYSTTTVWEWVEQATTNTFLNLTGLEAATEYEVKVGGVCANGVTSFSAPLRATTLALGQIQGLNCGQMPPLPAAGTPIASLAIGDVIMSGDFPVTLTKVAGGNGNFTGEGWVKIPWMGSTKIKVTFTNIGVNTEKKLTSGFLQTAYDPNWGNILNVDGIFEGGTNVGIVRSGRDTADFYANFPINGTGNITWNAATGTITVTGSGGQSQTFTGVTLPTTIKDNLGQIYGINANGQVIAIGRTVPMTMTSTELNTLSSDKGSVVFTQPIGTQKPIYAFDAYQAAYDKDVLWRTKYEVIGTYGVGRKAGAPGKPDIINASVLLADATFKADSVRFITAKGMQYVSKSLGSGVYEVNVVGGPGGDGQELYALYPKADGKYFSLGKVAVFSYTLQKRKLVLVPVKNAQINPSLMQKQLNDIYKPIGVEWEVESALAFNDVSWDANNNGLDVKGSGKFSVLTTEMKNLNKAYRTANSIYKEAIYMFVLDKASDSTVMGDMPRGKQFGYLFTLNNNDQAKTIAHEIGHGMFKLKHPSDGYNFTTNLLNNNLMDGGSGINLSKYQWDQIHDPGLALGIFDSDEDAFLVGSGARYKISEELGFLEEPNCTGSPKYEGVTPDGYPIKTEPAFKYRIIESNNYSVIGYTMVEGGREVEYKAIYDDVSKRYVYKLDGIKTGQLLTSFATDETVGKDVIIKIRRIIDNCYFESTNLCWQIPSKPFVFSEMMTSMSQSLSGKNWIIGVLVGCSSGTFKNDFAKTTGRFYSLGKPNEDQDKVRNLIERIDLLMKTLSLSSAEYDTYIKNPLSAKSRLSLTLGELEDLYQSLELVKTAKEFVSPATSTFTDIINWVKDCNGVNTQGCAVADNLVPRCLWDNNFASSSIGLPLPTGAGVIDGAYQMIKGIGDLAMLASKFQVGTAKFFNCWLNPLEFTSFGLDSECKTTRNDTKDALNYVKKFVGDPTTRTAVYGSYESFKTIIGQQFDTWWGQTFCFGTTNEQTRCCQYNQGRLMFDVASCFFGIGELKAAGTGATTLGTLSKIGEQFTKLNNLLGKLKVTSWVKLKLPALASSTRKTITGLLITLQLGTAGTAFDVGQITARSATLIESVIPIVSAVETEQAINLTTALGTTLTTAEAQALKVSAAAATESSTMMFPKVALEVGNVQKAAGNIGFVKTADNVIAVIVRAGTEQDFQVIARIKAAGVGAVIDFIQTPVNPDPSNSCAFCRTTDIALCKKLEQLALSTQKTAAVKRLCESSLLNPVLNSIVDKLNGFPTSVRTQFLTDIESGTASEDIANNINNLSFDILNAWDMTYRMNLGDNYKKDYSVLLKINMIINNSATMNLIGGETGLQTLIKKYQNSSCYTCTSSNIMTNIDKMSDYLDNVWHLNLYATKIFPGLKNKFIDIELKNNAPWKVHGAVFTLRVITKSTKYASQILEFEKEENINGKSRIADIYLFNGINNVYVDSKSWNEGNLRAYFQTNWGQFLDYFRRINKIEELEYWFDSKKVTKTEVIRAIYLLLLDGSKKDLFHPYGKLYPKGKELFDVIWFNNTLKESFFPRSNYAPNLSAAEYSDKAEADFERFIYNYGNDSNDTNKIFDFIKIK